MMFRVKEKNNRKPLKRNQVKSKNLLKKMLNNEKIKKTIKKTIKSQIKSINQPKIQKKRASPLKRNKITKKAKRTRKDSRIVTR
jgi:hypothetical protein